MVYNGNPYAGDGIDQPTVTTILGATGFSGFGNAANLSASNSFGLGVDLMDNLILVFGNEGRVVGTTGSTEGLLGLIDEIRISRVARGADEFLFAVPEPSTWALLGLGGLIGFLGLRRVRRR